MNSLGNHASLARDGRLLGSNVYMLLCQDSPADPVFVKVGVSTTPLERLRTILNGCPLTPWQFATCRVRSRERAFAVERELHTVLEPWHAQLEWYRVPIPQKTAFNTAWGTALRAMSETGWKLSWTMLRVQPYLRACRANGAQFQRRFRKSSRAVRDAKRAERAA